MIDCRCVTTFMTRGYLRCRAPPGSDESSGIASGDAAGYVIGDDWLEDDMPSSSKRAVKEPDLGGYARSSRKRSRPPPDTDDTKPVRRKIRKQSHDESVSTSQRSRSSIDLSMDDAAVAMQPREALSGQSSLHGLLSQTGDIFADPDVFVTSTQLPDSHGQAAPRSQPTVVTVLYRSISMVVPLDDE